MDKQKLRYTFDCFNPTKEQKQKMYDKIIEKTYEKKVYDFKKIYLPVTSAVAVLIIAILSIGNLKYDIISTQSTDMINQTVNLVLNDMPITPNGRMVPAPINETNESSYSLTSDEYKGNKKKTKEKAINPHIPQDMEKATQSDEYNMKYTGDGARCINITINKNTSENEQYIENDNYKKTYVSGHQAVVFYDGNYTVYMNINNIGYKITAVEVSEKEISDLLLSLTK